jgi:hypothetical protein
MRFILTGKAAEDYLQAYAEGACTALTIGGIFAIVLWLAYTFGVRIGVNTHLKISIVMLVTSSFVLSALFGLLPDQVEMIRAGVPVDTARLNSKLFAGIFLITIVLGVAASLYPVFGVKRTVSRNSRH